MRRERYALLFLLLILLATLTLGYGMTSYFSGKENKTQNLISGLFSETSNNPKHKGSNPAKMSLSNFGGNSGRNYQPGVPTSDFKFTPANKRTHCPVAILPKDPMLVCVKTPAKSIPLLSWNLPDKFEMIVWYQGTYYIPYVKKPSQPVSLKGINGPRDYIIDTSTPLVMITYGVSKEFRVYTNSTGNLKFTSSLPIKIESKDRNGSMVYYTLKIKALTENYTAGYYPIFVLTTNKSRKIALLMWIALLKKPVVKITNYPSTIAGNGVLHVNISGRVTYPDGSPVKDGLVTITLNRTKGIKGISVGITTVKNGIFTLKATVPSYELPGSYHIIAYYSGYLAYPSNSDPVLLIKRKPEIKMERINGTLKLFLNWNGHPLPKRTIKISIGNRSLKLRTNKSGYILLTLKNTTGKIGVLYPGDELYLPLNETLLIPQEKYGLKSSSTKTKTNRRNPHLLSFLKFVLGFIIMAGLAYVIISKRKTMPMHIAPKKSKETDKVNILSPSRKIFLPEETIQIILNRPCRAFLNGKALGTGRIFEIRPPLGRHVFSAENVDFEFYVLPPRDAIIKSYHMYLLPFAKSLGVITDEKTPSEIARSLNFEGLKGIQLDNATRIFVLADYAERPLNSTDFWKFIHALEELEVFENGNEHN